MQETLDAVDQHGDIDRRRLQFLPAGECEEALGQRSAALCAFDRIVEQSQRPLVGHAFAHKIEAAKNCHE